MCADFIVTVQMHMGNRVGDGGGYSYCEIPVEGNWNSIGVRSWLLPQLL